MDNKSSKKYVFKREQKTGSDGADVMQKTVPDLYSGEWKSSVAMG